VVIALAAVLFLVEWLPTLIGTYGYFIDELYYLACASRPSWGYVDHPPLSVVALAALRRIVGDGLPAIRLAPAVAGSATVLLTGALARRLGADSFGQVLAALSVLFAPIPLIMFGLYSMNAFEILLWTALFHVLVVLLEKDEPRWWLVFGLLAGISLLNKHTTVLLGAGVAIGIVLTPTRKHLSTPWPWLGLGLATLILTPNLVWQHANGWPSLEFYRNADLYKNVPTPPLEVLVQQILFYNPGAFPVWLAGLGFFLVSRMGRRHRLIGWACITLLILMVASQKSRPDRIAAMYPVLFAAGATWIGAVAANRRFRWARPASIVVVTASGLLFLPLAVPVLPPALTARYATVTGVVPQIEAGEGKASQLPQWFADRFGWVEFVADVRSAAESLPPARAEEAAILVPSYGHGGALELIGGDSLPPILCAQNTFHMWGSALLAHRDVQGGIAVGFSTETLERLWHQVERVGVHRCDHCMPWRSEMSLYRVWGPKVPLARVWPQFKHYE
jgi:4-amino-4-deoxy-L-arabinose transferase-like glycosyltransferase